MEDFVHDYSVERFKKAYKSTFKPMKSQEQWPRVDLGYKLMKPKSRRRPGRPKVYRIEAFDELGNKKKRRCTKCDELAHTAKYCQGRPTASKGGGTMHLEREQVTLYMYKLSMQVKVGLQMKLNLKVL